MIPRLKVNTVKFIKHHVWYMSIVRVNGHICTFWSFHDRTGLTDETAKTKFTREHFNEVSYLITQKIKEDENRNGNRN